MEIVFKEKDGQLLCRTLRPDIFRQTYQKHPSAPTTNSITRSGNVESIQNREGNVMHNVAMIASQSDDQAVHRLFSKAKANNTRAQNWIEYKILSKDLELEPKLAESCPSKLAEFKDFEDKNHRENHRKVVLDFLCDALQNTTKDPDCSETRCRKHSIKHVMKR